MSTEIGILDLKYDIEGDRFEVSGNLNLEGQKTVVDAFLTEQIGAGVDTSPAAKMDVYHIRLQWYPENDDIRVSDNTENKGLRDGILMRFRRELGD